MVSSFVCLLWCFSSFSLEQTPRLGITSHWIYVFTATDWQGPLEGSHGYHSATSWATPSMRPTQLSFPPAIYENAYHSRLTSIWIFANMIAAPQVLVIKTNFLSQKEKQFLSPKCSHEREAHWCHYQTSRPLSSKKHLSLEMKRRKCPSSEVTHWEDLCGKRSH